MLEYFDIFGTPIPFSEIKDFRVLQREYIFRPKYEEVIQTEKSLFRTSVTKRCFRYVGMEPYAAIIDESDRRWIFSGKSYKEHIGAELLNDVRETVGEKFKLKAIKGKRYHCMNQTGRKFQIYLDEVPVLIRMSDGRPVEVNKDTALFAELGEAVLPAINIVPVLLIQAKENYLFWGNGIQIADIESEYRRLIYEITEYKQNIGIETKARKAIEKKNFPMPNISKFNKNKGEEVNVEIKED